MTDRPNVAIVGLGKMGLVHAAAVTVAGGRIVGLVDRRRRTLGNARWMGLRAPFHTSLDDLFGRGVPDAVFVSVPSNANLGVARACHQAGVRGIFLEKPLADSVESADELAQIAEGHPLLVDAVGFMLRHVPTLRHAQRLIEDGAVGQVREAGAEAYMDAKLPERGSWFRRRTASGGGALVSLGSHLLSLLDAVLGTLESVDTVKLIQGTGEVEDRARVALTYPGDVRTTLSVGWDVSGYEALHVALTFTGTGGQLAADLQRVALTKPTGERIWTERQLPDDAPGFVGGRGYVRQDSQFLAAVAGQEAERVTWKEGGRVQHALARLYSASEFAA
jgi:predicted dehydrogenase